MPTFYDADTTTTTETPSESSDLAGSEGGVDGHDEIDQLVEKQKSLSLTDPACHENILICDAGYGLPREARPRREKVLAIARQLVNFLQFQEEYGEKNNHKYVAKVQVVGCKDEATLSALEDRTRELYGQDALPGHVSFSCQALEDFCDEKSQSVSNEREATYLSPDAEVMLDPAGRPPAIAIVGLLIDRRVQPNRSNDRASKLKIRAARWPLETSFQNIHSNEPLNVDCILEGMQQWYWNWNDDSVPAFQTNKKECFVQAATVALGRHTQRHPSRPLHKE